MVKASAVLASDMSLSRRSRCIGCGGAVCTAATCACDACRRCGGGGGLFTTGMNETERLDRRSDGELLTSDSLDEVDGVSSRGCLWRRRAAPAAPLLSRVRLCLRRAEDERAVRRTTSGDTSRTVREVRADGARAASSSAPDCTACWAEGRGRGCKCCAPPGPIAFRCEIVSCVRPRCMLAPLAARSMRPVGAGPAGDPCDIGNAFGRLLGTISLVGCPLADIRSTALVRCSCNSRFNTTEMWLDRTRKTASAEGPNVPPIALLNFTTPIVLPSLRKAQHSTLPSCERQTPSAELV